MSKIKVAELFYSIQGEGRYTGAPSVFLRTFGCNFSCRGFGMPKGQASTEADKIAERVSEFKFYHELPLTSTGCDSYASWHPKFKHLSETYDTDNIAESIIALLPYKEWRDEHLVITGGEPLLGWQRAYPELLEHPKMCSLKELTFETNGTQELTSDFKDYLKQWNQQRFPHGNGGEITFSVSPKLSCSGEVQAEAIRPEIVCEYENYGYTYLKFVVATQEDANEALEAVNAYQAHGFTGPVYLMPVGGVPDVYNLNTQEVAKLAMDHGWRYSPRLQVDIWRNAWGT